MEYNRKVGKQCLLFVQKKVVNLIDFRRKDNLNDSYSYNIVTAISLEIYVDQLYL